jgi:catechol 2,3-dioxygenase-like lactoylglutathione lyase family enzyme
LEKIPTVFGAAMIAACLEVIGAIVSDMQKAIDFYQRPDRVHRDLIDGLPTGLR